MLLFYPVLVLANVQADQTVWDEDPAEFIRNKFDSFQEGTGFLFFYTLDNVRVFIRTQGRVSRGPQ